MYSRHPWIERNLDWNSGDLGAFHLLIACSSGPRISHLWPEDSRLKSWAFYVFAPANLMYSKRPYMLSSPPTDTINPHLWCLGLLDEFRWNHKQFEVELAHGEQPHNNKERRRLRVVVVVHDLIQSTFFSNGVVRTVQLRLL